VAGMKGPRQCCKSWCKNVATVFLCGNEDLCEYHANQLGLKMLLKEFGQVPPCLDHYDDEDEWGSFAWHRKFRREGKVAPTIDHCFWQLEDGELVSEPYPSSENDPRALHYHPDL
jgi:hypothetical protein